MVDKAQPAFWAAVSDLGKLAIPMIVSRAGLATMAIADAVMVSRFSPSEFAGLSLADGTIGRIVEVFAAFVMGGLVLVPRAFGAGDTAEAFRIWRRSLAPAVGLGLLGCLIGFAGTTLFTLLGQGSELAVSGGTLSAILGVGYVAALVAISAAIFLEGVRQPVVVAVSVIAANVLNISLNWLLIGGNWGFPALGARGSAISTTIVRFALALVLAAFAFSMRKRSSAKVVTEIATPDIQHEMGLASAIVQAIMLSLIASLLVFAGWLGALPLAVLSAILTLNAPMMLIALGLADATGIRVASNDGQRAIGQSGQPRSIVVLSAMVTAAITALMMAAWNLFPEFLARIFTNDKAMLQALVPLIPLASFLVVLDSFVFVVISALRALRDIVVPTGIEISTIAAMIPLAWMLTSHRSEGVKGLIMAAVCSAAFRLALLIWRFLWITKTS
jgi:MATE family multidrug resistance protein